MSGENEKVAPVPSAAVQEEIDRTWRSYWPGKMGFDPTNGASGCKVMAFEADSLTQAAEKVNQFFADNPGLLCVKLEPCISDMNFTYTAIYTKHVDPREEADMNEVLAKARELIDQKYAEAEKQKVIMEELERQTKENAEKLRIATEKERNRLVELGKVHEKNCSKKGKK